MVVGAVIYQVPTLSYIDSKVCIPFNVPVVQPVTSIFWSTSRLVGVEASVKVTILVVQLAWVIVIVPFTVPLVANGNWPKAVLPPDNPNNGSLLNTAYTNSNHPWPEGCPDQSWLIWIGSGNNNVSNGPTIPPPIVTEPEPVNTIVIWYDAAFTEVIW